MRKITIKNINESEKYELDIRIKLISVYSKIFMWSAGSIPLIFYFAFIRTNQLDIKCNFAQILSLLSKIILLESGSLSLCIIFLYRINIIDREINHILGLKDDIDKNAQFIKLISIFLLIFVFIILAYSWH